MVGPDPAAVPLAGNMGANAGGLGWTPTAGRPAYSPFGPPLVRAPISETGCLDYAPTCAVELSLPQRVCLRHRQDSGFQLYLCASPQLLGRSPTRIDRVHRNDA